MAASIHQVGKLTFCEIKQPPSLERELEEQEPDSRALEICEKWGISLKAFKQITGGIILLRQSAAEKAKALGQLQSEIQILKTLASQSPSSSDEDLPNPKIQRLKEEIGTLKSELVAIGESLKLAETAKNAASEEFYRLKALQPGSKKANQNRAAKLRLAQKHKSRCENEYNKLEKQKLIKTEDLSRLEIQLSHLSKPNEQSSGQIDAEELKNRLDFALIRWNLVNEDLKNDQIAIEELINQFLEEHIVTEKRHMLKDMLKRFRQFE